MFQKSIIGALLILSSAATLAAPALPFIGERSFNFYGDFADQINITITRNGQYYFSACHMGSCSKSKSKKWIDNTIRDDNRQGRFYFLTSEFVKIIDPNHEVLNICSTNEYGSVEVTDNGAEPCVSKYN